jgi:hypothetical protein
VPGERQLPYAAGGSGCGRRTLAEGVRIEKTWDAPACAAPAATTSCSRTSSWPRGRSSPAARGGELDRPLLVASLHAWPAIYSTYLGVAEGLVDTIRASRQVREGAARVLGQVDFLLRQARWALEGVLADLGDDPDPTIDNFVALQQMKRSVTARPGLADEGARHLTALYRVEVGA